MIRLLVSGFSFLFLIYVYFKISDERGNERTLKNWIKSAAVIIAAASIISYGKNILVLMAAVSVGMIALVKRKNNRQDA